MKHLLLLLFLQFTTQVVFAFPIEPQTLRKLIESSAYIVIAKVDNPTTKIGKETYYEDDDGLANLYINETLKGNLDAADIQVTYIAGMVCPAPPEYPNHSTVLTFLNKNETDSTFSTQGLSYGSKIMISEAALSAYRTRIIEYLEILKIANLHQRKAATVEWLVKCSENKFTRWEGAYELARKAGFSFYYDRSTDPKFYKQLSKSQLQRLDAAFFATDTIGYNELCLANLVSKKSSQRLKNHLLHNLAFADYYLAEDIMRKIMDIDPSNELHSIYIEARNISYNDKEKEAKQKVIIAKFISAASKQ
jgi:hypothetical protein